jgi:hypothetical protein
MNAPLRQSCSLRAARILGFCSLLLLSVLAGPTPSAAQDAASDVTYTKQPLFRIPFQTDPNDRRIKQVWLYVSSDQGHSWHPNSNVKPEEGAFMFNATRDGLYWFSVRTVDLDDRAFPVTMTGAKPGLKVIVDSTPPAITLRPLPQRDGQYGVSWEIQEDNPDWLSFALEARPQGIGDWTPIQAEASPNGSTYWKPNSTGPLEVRLRLRDKAGNDGLGRTLMQGSQENQAPIETPNTPAPAGTAVRMVNSKRFTLNYEVTKIGKSGVSAVELWSTPDGRRWEKLSEQKRTEGNEIRPPYEVNVEKEGLYGFTLVLRSGVGLSVQSPQAGDPPQVWVEVDLTKPVVRITKVDVGRGPQAGSLAIHWTATDKNLGRTPITISFADKPDGQWTQIIANRENTGQYIWRMPPDVPSQVYLRVEAVDRAGNVGSAETGKPVIVDLVLPTIEIKDVAPNK